MSDSYSAVTVGLAGHGQLSAVVTVRETPVYVVPTAETVNVE